MSLSLPAPRRPSVCFVPTASAEDPRLVAEAVAALDAAGAVPSVLVLFPWPDVDDVTAHLLAQDVSAGSLCWHSGGTTDSYGPELRPVLDGLRLLPHSNCPHDDVEPQRRPLYQRLVAESSLPSGWATDDGVGLHSSGSELVDVVSGSAGPSAWHVTADGAGSARETRIVPRLLPGA